MNMFALMLTCAIITYIVKEVPMSSQHTNRQPGLTVVATVSGMLKAQVLKAQLEDSGIPALLEYESAGTIFGLTVDGLQLSQVRILVADRDAQEAQRILETPPPPGWEEEAIDTTQ
jgi:hypothetical protein